MKERHQQPQAGRSTSPPREKEGIGFDPQKSGSAAENAETNGWLSDDQSPTHTNRMQRGRKQKSNNQVGTTIKRHRGR